MEPRAEIDIFRVLGLRLARETGFATGLLAAASVPLFGPKPALGLALGGAAGVAVLLHMVREVALRARTGGTDALRRSRKGLVLRLGIRAAALGGAAAMGRAALIGACAGLFVAQFVLLFRGGTPRQPEG